MFDGLFTTTQTRPKTNKRFEGLFNSITKPTIAPVASTIKTSTLPDFLGGGAYNTVIGQPDKLATSTRAYAGVDTIKDKDRHHIIPVELGGSSITDKNIENLDVKAHARITDAEFAISRDYNAKKMSLPEARLKMMGALQKELDAQKGMKQGVFANLWGGIKQLGSDIKNIPKTLQNNLGEQFKKTEPQPLPISRIEQEKQFQEGTKKIAKNVAPFLQFPQRAAVSVGLEMPAATLSLIKNKNIEAKYTPKTAFEKMVFGEEPIKGVFTEEAEAEKKSNELLQKLGFDKATSQGMSLALAPLFVGGLKGTDLTPMGGGKKVVGKIADDIIRNLKSVDVSIMERFIDYVRLGKKTVDPALEKEARYLMEGVGLKQEVSNVKIANTFDDALQRYGQVGEPAKPLAQEAGKLYHGTSADIQGEKLSFGAGDIKKGGQSGGLFLTDTKESAQVFGKTVYEASPEIKSQVIDLTKPSGIKQIENYIGKSYKTFDGEIVKFTRQDFESMFPNGKADFATVSQFPELVDMVVSDAKLRGIAFNEYAGGKVGKTYQILNGDIPINQSKAVGETKLADNIANEMGFAKLPKVMVRSAESIAPIKNQNPVVQSTFKTWTRELLLAEEQANKQVAKIPKLADNFDTILKYEKGTPTTYSGVIKKEFDALFEKAKQAGVSAFDKIKGEFTDVQYKKNYVPQVYNNTLEEVKTAMSKYMKDKGVDLGALDDYLNGIKELPDVLSKRLKLNPFFSKERAFPNYETAIKYGLKPKFTEPSQLLAHYDAELSKTVANRKFLDDLVSKGQVKTVEQAGSDWEALTLPFSPKGYYAPPELAKMLNGMFRNEEMLGAGATAFKVGSQLSRTMQEIVLSAGIPKTNINFFAIGQLVKNLTAGELKAATAFIRSNFNAPSIKFFAENGKTLESMANQGIDILKRVDGYTEIYKKLSDAKGISAKVGVIWDKAFGEKTFNSFMPQMQVQTFKDVYNKALKKLPIEQAEKLAGDTVKAFYGLHENLGRGKGTEDVLGAVFFAPKFREGIINTLFNTGKSITTEIFNPAFSKNRKLLAGMILSYAGYNALNKKLTGHYMWENAPGKEFDLEIPTKLGNTQDDVIYIGFMPSFLAFARNMASGGIALVKGDMPTAKQKLGSLASMPIKIASEMWANKDYFGNKIYDDYDDTKTKTLKLAKYAYLSVNHPFIKEIQNQLTTDKPVYQSISTALELPLKFSSYTKIEKQQFYDAIYKQQAKEAKIKADFKPKYTEVRDLLETGKIDEATALTNSMTDEEFKLYESLKRADKTRASVNAEIKVFSDYKQIKELMANGQIDEATAITNKMTDDEYKAYKRLKAKLQ